MAAFSSLALLGLGMAAGSAASKLAKRRRNPADSGVLAPGASAAPTAPPPPAPPPAARATSDAMAQAQQASQRQRRRAASAGARGLPSPRRNPVAALQPRTLLGTPTSFLGGA